MTLSGIFPSEESQARKIHLQEALSSVLAEGLNQSVHSVRKCDIGSIDFRYACSMFWRKVMILGDKIFSKKNL